MFTPTSQGRDPNNRNEPQVPLLQWGDCADLRGSWRTIRVPGQSSLRVWGLLSGWWLRWCEGLRQRLLIPRLSPERHQVVAIIMSRRS